MVLLSILAYIVTLGVLVTVHEYGHFWVARRLGVKVLRFSIGFGRPLYSRTFGADATEFSICALPLGGYVRMLDEREGPVEPGEVHRAFNRQSLATRTAVVAAGPLANFLFAVIAYWAMFVHGVAGIAPIIGEVRPDTPAAQARLLPGDRILSVEGDAVPTWEAAIQRLVGRVLEAESVHLEIRSANGHERAVTLDLGALHVDDVGRGELLQRLGTLPQSVRIEPVIGRIVAGSPAERAGLAPADRVLYADGEKVTDFADLVRRVQERPGEPVVFIVDRAGTQLELSVRPDSVPQGERYIGRIGAGHDPAAVIDEREAAVERYDVLTALLRGVDKTVTIAGMTVGVMGRMLVGQASVENLSGPIAIAEYAGRSALFGVTAFVSFLAAVSISLGVLNLLPVPPLDGGHLLNYLVEFVQRKPLSEAAQMRLLQMGLMLLMILTAIALTNDLTRATLNG
ncbi:MAG TPA: RIP metalloprotease RseP [Gammaproteobacteria bacterium]|nr:RIP metalloprotease RseP [Gammaproteobacteria bacterium]